MIFLSFSSSQPFKCRRIREHSIIEHNHHNIWLICIYIFQYAIIITLILCIQIYQFVEIQRQKTPHCSQASYAFFIRISSLSLGNHRLLFLDSKNKQNFLQSPISHPRCIQFILSIQAFYINQYFFII